MHEPFGAPPDQSSRSTGAPPGNSPWPSRKPTCAPLGRRPHRCGAARLTDRFPAPASDPPLPAAGRRSAIRCRPPALVCGRADRDDRDGPVFDARVLADGRRGAGRHRAGLCGGFRGRRSLSLAHQEPAHARRPPDRHRGLDGAARRLRHPGCARPVGPVRQARHGSGTSTCGSRAAGSSWRSPRSSAAVDRAALLSVPVHRRDHRRRALVHVDGPRALDRRQRPRRLGDAPAGLALVRPRHARRRLDRRLRGGAATLPSGCICSA